MEHLSLAEIAIIKARIFRGDAYRIIASDFSINQVRLYDLKHGRIYRNICPAILTSP